MLLGTHDACHILALATEMHFVFATMLGAVKLMVARDPEDMLEVLLSDCERVIQLFDGLAD